MKMNKMNMRFAQIAFLSVLVVFLSGCNGNQDQAGDTQSANNENGMEMQGAATDIYVSYMDIKNALVNDDYEQAKSAAEDMLEDTEDSEVRESVQQIANAEDISAQREYFAALSQNLYEKVKAEGEVERTLYWKYCPMALNNEGGNWLSYEEQIQNPYMGQKMLECGSVEETLE